MKLLWVGVCIGLVWAFKSLIMLCMISVSLVYLLSPVDRLFRKVSPVFAAVLSTILGSTVIFSVIYSFFKIAKSTFLEIQKNPKSITDNLELFFGNWGEVLQQISAYINENISEIVLQGISVFLGFLKVGAVILVAFYILLDWNFWIEKISKHGKQHKNKIKNLLLKIDESLENWATGQFIVFSILFPYYLFFLWIFGLPYFFEIALLSTLLMLIPYLGIIACASAAIAISAQHNFSLTKILCVGSVFTFGTFLENVFLTPNLIGKRIGLNPLVFLISSIILWQLFDFIGAIVTIPTLCVARVIFNYVKEEVL